MSPIFTVFYRLIKSRKSSYHAGSQKLSYFIVCCNLLYFYNVVGFLLYFFGAKIAPQKALILPPKNEKSDTKKSAALSKKECMTDYEDVKR